MFDVHEASLSRAGVPTVYNAQCFNSGPTGRCVRVPLLDRMDLFFFFFLNRPWPMCCTVRRQRGWTRVAQLRRRVL